MIPFNEHPTFDLGELPHINDAVMELAINGRVTGGRIVTEFEEAVRSLYDVEHAISFGSGTMGLYASLCYFKEKYRREKILGVDYIFMPSFTWDSVFWAAETADLMPIYCDVDPDTYHITGDVHPIPEGNTLMLMDTFGSLCPHNDSFEDVIVDASHSFGAPRRGLRGLTEVFSFNGGKIVTTGEGGMVVTNDKDAANYIIRLRNLLSRMPVLCAATGLEWFNRLDEILEKKKEISDIYNRSLNRTFISQKIPIVTNHYICAFRHHHSQELINNVKDHIDCRKYYYPAMGESKYISNANLVGKELICLPNGYYTDAEVISNQLNTISDELEG